MEVVMIVVAVGIATVLLAVSAFGAVVALLSVLAGERLRRCPHCGRVAMTAQGAVHSDRCPPPLHERLAHAWHHPGLLHH
jgi:hypothetical protein